VPRIGEVNEQSGNLRHGLDTMALPPRSDEGKKKAEKQETGRHQVGQNTDVRIGKMRDGIQDEQKQKGKQAARRDNQPGQTEPIAQHGQAPACRGAALFLVIH
jgi:hypothetical protein